MLSHFSRIQRFCEPTDCSLPGSCVHGILQARILECVARPSSRGSSRPRDWSHVSYDSRLAGGIFTTSATWEAFHSESYALLHFVASLSSIFLFVSSPLVFPIRQWMLWGETSFPTVVHIYSGVLLSHKKNEIMWFAAKDGSRDYHTKWRKSDRERQISYDIIYLCNLKKR